MAAFALASASVAWACLPQAIFTIGPSKGAPGTTATASGSGFPAGPIEIRWESRTGEHLATAVGPSFSVPIKIPSATPGNHYVLAGTDPNVKTAPFEVTDISPPPEASPQPSPDPEPQASPDPQPQSGPNPGPLSAQPPPQTAASRRTKAVTACKRKYKPRRAKTTAKRRRVAKKRRACIRAAKRLPATSSYDRSSFHRRAGLLVVVIDALVAEGISAFSE